MPQLLLEFGILQTKNQRLKCDIIFKSQCLKGIEQCDKKIFPIKISVFLLFAAIALPCTIAGKARKPNCNDFAKNAEFKESDAIGTWHLHGPEIHKSTKEAKCIQFSAVDEKVI